MTRRLTTPEEAAPLIDALLARRVDGPLPALPKAPTIHEACEELERLPLAERLPLHARGLFAAATLEPAARELEGWLRDDFFLQIGAAAGVSARVMLAAVRAGRFPLTPPRPIRRYEYLGAFRSSGRLEVADPCYLRKRSPIGVAISLSHAVDVHPGAWHVFVRDGRDDAADRTAELAAIHDDGFDVAAAERIAYIGVDAGMAGVFDSECPEPAQTDLMTESIVHGRGAFARSGYGDGIYPVYAGKVDGLVAKLRINFKLDERPEIDATIPARPGRRYAASATFAFGDIVEHPKFGTGAVVGAADGKIDVEFDDGRRTLVHGRR